MRFDAETVSKDHIKARCTPGERQAVADAAALKGMTLSQFVRIAVLDRAIKTPDGPPTRAERHLCMAASAVLGAKLGLPPIVITLARAGNGWSLTKRIGDMDVATVTFGSRSEVTAAVVALVDLASIFVIGEASFDDAPATAH